jgi:hypothetical protein
MDSQLFIVLLSCYFYVIRFHGQWEFRNDNAIDLKGVQGTNLTTDKEIGQPYADIKFHPLPLPFVPRPPHLPSLLGLCFFKRVRYRSNSPTNNTIMSNELVVIARLLTPGGEVRDQV